MSPKLPAVAPCACGCRARSREAKRPGTHVTNERFDEAGFEVPFAASFEGGALSQSEATSSAESDSQAEAGSAYENEPESSGESETEGEGEGGLSEHEWGEAEDETGAEAVGEAAPVLEMESRSRAARLELFQAWRKLLLMKVDDGIQTALAKRKMRVQYAHNESYSNDLNFDLYPVRINRFPSSGGTVMTPERFLKHVRLNLNNFLDTSISRFHPYSIGEAALWALDNPSGIVLKIDIPFRRVLDVEIPGDNASVVVSSASPLGWVFSTVTTPATGTHPVSGHRNFFLAQKDGTYYFINKGLDMTSSGIAGLGLPIAGSYGYGRGDALWRSLQDKLTKFINANGGDAKTETRISERVEWRYVYHRYREELERVFGKGAGSSRNSPFFDITDEVAESEIENAGEHEDRRFRAARGRRFLPTRAALGRTTEESESKPQTPQQKRWPCDATPPKCMTPAVSADQFGIALQRFTDERCVNGQVPTLLRQSATFMARVKTLDKKYAALDGAMCTHKAHDWWTVWAPNANGVLTKGPFAGRRVLTMLYSFSGSLFLPSNSVDNGYGYDLIVIKLPDGIGPDGKPHSGGSASSARVIVQWISAIAHETVHAHTFVTATGAPAATIPLRVAAAIKEEAATRALEGTILNEIAATADGAFLSAAVKGVAGPTDTSRVQRGFFPGEDRVTYLEHFVLTERMLDAIRREKLKPADIARIDTEIDAIDLTLRALDKNLTDTLPIYFDAGVPAGKTSKGVSGKAQFKTISTDYGRFRFWKRVMAARWSALEKRLGSMPGPTDPAREKVAQEHAKAFFGGLVGYDALPVVQKPTQTPKPKPKKEADEADIAGEWEDTMHRPRRVADSGGAGGRAPARGSPPTPVPAWADAIDPFPASVTVGLDRSNALMTTAFAPVTVSTANHLCAALADVTGGTSAPAPFAALRETEMLYLGSLPKVGVMYAAFALRARVQAFADAAKANGVTTAADVFGLIKRAWAPKLKALFPARPTLSFGNGQDVTVPQVDKIFTLSPMGKIEFAIASPAITLADLDRVRDKGAPIGRFHEWMRLMMRWSNDSASSRCILALGYFYINGLFATSGFFNAGKGLWISGDYAGHDWVRTTTEFNSNAAGVALDLRWATAQKRMKSNFVGNALQVGRLMTAMAQDTLVDAASCAEMRRLANQLSGGIGSYARTALRAVGRTPAALSSKIGFGDDSFSHDCAIVERTVGGKRLRYAAVVLGSAPAQRRRDLRDLFVLLDAVVVARNP